MGAVKTLTSEGIFLTVLLNLLCKERNELNIADLPHSYNHRFAHVKFMTVRAAVEAKCFFDVQLLASYFFECSQSEKRIV